MKIILAFCLVVLHTMTQQVYEQPDKFGLLTVTYARNGDFSVFKRYLKLYTETQCYADLIEQINIVWNNEMSPEGAGVYEREKFWRIPVNFYRTKFNSMDHRYRLLKQSAARVLYSLDDDIIVDCQTFAKTFEQFQKVNHLEVGPIVANQVRAFAYHLEKKPEFAYQGHKNATYFTVAEPGAAFIPRHYLEIYYLALPEFLEFRKQVREVKNCDDLFFAAMSQHLYPELPPFYTPPADKTYKNTDPKVGQSKVKNVYTIRDKCLNDISEVLGYNSLRYFSKNGTARAKNWEFDNLAIIVQTKIKGLNTVAMEKAEEKEFDAKAEAQREQELEKEKDTELLADIMPAPNSQEVAQSKADLLAKQQSSLKPTPIEPKDEQLTKVEPSSTVRPLLLKEEYFFALVVALAFLITILLVCLYRLLQRYNELNTQFRSLRQQSEQDPSESFPTAHP